MQVGIVYSLRNMYIIESQSDHQAPAASVIEKKPPQTETLILVGEEKHSLGRKLMDSCTRDRCSEVLLLFAKIRMLKKDSCGAAEVTSMRTSNCAARCYLTGHTKVTTHTH